MSYKIGLDVGSTTIKSIVLDKENNIIYKSYDRHKAKVREKATELLEYISKEYLSGEKNVRIAVTGSSGLGLAQQNNLPFVQEVYSTQLAIRKYYPDTDTIIELGGEDAKILFLSGTPEVRMNGSCAGGTGAFIDQMAILLGVDLDEFDRLSLDYNKLYTIASRCGVFAKSDVQPLVNQGAQKNDLAASIFQAVVNQTIGGLAQGRDIEGKVAFLGGPLTFFQGLRKRFTETLKLDEHHALFPENGQYFIALGAAVYAEKNTDSINIESVLQSLRKKREKNVQTTIKPLFADEKEYDEFIRRHASVTIGYKDIASYHGDAYIGVDAGSTTTKIILITPDKEILYEKYISNAGNAVPIVRDALVEIYEAIGDRIKIKGSAVTGYGEELIKNAFNLDFGIVETVAHFTGAKYFKPNVDFIIDIGGQDMKCFKLKNNAVDSILLNEACSSGCGSFLETFATSLGYSMEEFAQKGLFASSPVDLGSRCTVFMNSSVKQAQKEGATVSDISAGLSVSVVKNAVYKVIRASNPKELGQNIVVQGGTFLNNAVLRAFEKELDIHVLRTPISGLMGAFGCALYALNNAKEDSSTLDLEGLQSFKHEVKASMCRHCENNCRLTINIFPGNKRYISGNKCERYTGNLKQDIQYNEYEYKYDKLMKLQGGGGKRGKIGIPMVLNMYELLPFWHAFFTALDFEIVLSPRSNRELYIKGQHTIPSDTVCYPAKLAHGAIEELVEAGVDAVFYPCLTFNLDEEIGDNHYNCPVVAYYPEVIEANVSTVKKVPYINDYVGIHRRKDFKNKIKKVLEQYFTLPPKEVEAATDKAYAAHEAYIRDVKDYSKKAIRYAEEHNYPVIVLAGRPYHIDPEINHGIDKLITGYGAVVISEDGISTVGKDKPKVNVLNQWTYHSRLYSAAGQIGNYKNMNLIQLVSFGCGVDSITTDEVRSILEDNGQLYTQIKIDEISNLGATKIRVRSLFAAIEERQNGGE